MEMIYPQLLYLFMTMSEIRSRPPEGHLESEQLWLSLSGTVGCVAEPGTVCKLHEPSVPGLGSPRLPVRMHPFDLLPMFLFPQTSSLQPLLPSPTPKAGLLTLLSESGYTLALCSGYFER